MLAFVKDRDRYALSMSPALSIVTANLLNTEAEISWTWQGFESIVMLSELKRMVTKSPTISEHLDRLVFELQSPAPSSSTSFSFPLVDNTTVILNGARASYADVIAPYRLIQAKFSRDDAKPAALNLTEELDKMGLTDSVDHLIQQHLTKTIYTMWSVPRSISEVTRSEARHSVNKDTRMECYPMSTLNICQGIDELQMIVGRLSPAESMGGAPGDKKSKKVFIINGISESELIKEFDESRPVTAVFATNCKAFQLTKTGITISSSDVDIEGKLKVKALPEHLSLQKNVEIRFVFF